jgi:type IV secretory pathway TrbD component
MNIPLHHAATERIMMGGIPRRIAILGGTMAASLVFGLHDLYVIPVIAIVYITLTVLYRCDPYFIEILLAHIKEDDYLYP